MGSSPTWGSFFKFVFTFNFVMWITAWRVYDNWFCHISPVRISELEDRLRSKSTAEKALEQQKEACACHVIYGVLNHMTCDKVHVHVCMLCANSSDSHVTCVLTNRNRGSSWKSWRDHWQLSRKNLCTREVRWAVSHATEEKKGCVWLFIPGGVWVRVWVWGVDVSVHI